MGLFINREGKAYGSGFGSLGQLGIASCDDADVVQPIGGKALENLPLRWTGTGGYFSMVAGLSPATNGS